MPSSCSAVHQFRHTYIWFSGDIRRHSSKEPIVFHFLMYLCSLRIVEENNISGQVRQCCVKYNKIHLPPSAYACGLNLGAMFYVETAGSPRGTLCNPYWIKIDSIWWGRWETEVAE